MLERSTTADSGTWDSIWSDRGIDSPGWDYLSEVIFRVLEREIGGIEGKRILEAGSGSGRISLGLAKRSGKVSLLDYSQNALKASRELFDKNKAGASSLRADIRNIPVKNSSYDIVWNAGVMEHYDYAQQGRIMGSLVDICRPGGKVITLNPYSMSIIYKAAKGVLTMLGRWPFGREYPISSIRDIYDPKDKGYEIREYPIGFIVFFIDAYKFLPRSVQRLKAIKAISGIFIKSAKQLFAFDRILARIFGGYLLVSVIRKKGR